MWPLTLLGRKFAQQQEKFTHSKVDVDSFLSHNIFFIFAKLSALTFWLSGLSFLSALESSPVLKL